MKLPIINGRECIPLRLIRFVTCGRFSADVLLLHLCHEEGPEHLPLYAYSYPGNKIEESSAWGNIARMVQALSKKPEIQDDEWIEESTKALSPGVFVYRDEFESYSKCWQPEDDVFSYSLAGVPVSLLQAVWEGFENPSLGEIVSKSNVRQNEVSKASSALKSLQTAEIDKKIVDVIQTIDSAIREHLREKKPGMVVNHISFLKEVGIDSKKRAKDKVKAYIEKYYSEYGYSVISRRPAVKDGRFVTS